MTTFRTCGYRLLKIADSQAVYDQKIVQNRKNLLELLQDLQLKIELADLIEISSRIAPRYYTICSSPAANPNSLDIVISLVQDKLHNGKTWEGLVSQQIRELLDLSNRNQQGICRIAVAESTFVLPDTPATPIICVGPGTGVAPFRAFLQEKEVKREASNIGNITLFFGCRKRDSDYIYRESIERWQKTKVLDQLHLAISRETSQKVYVQHLIKQNAEEIAKAIVEQRARVYVCGSHSMGKEVEQLIKTILIDRLGKADGEKFFEDLENKKHFISELWGQ